MNLTVKYIDKSLLKPKYHTKGSVAFDLRARKNVTIKPFAPTIIPLNVVIKVPEGHLLLLAARSSLPLKKHLMVANGIGIIDQDYCGDEDEVGLQVINFGKRDVTVKRGERIAQALLVPITKVDKFISVNKVTSCSRGGFGSTGGHRK